MALGSNVPAGVQNAIQQNYLQEKFQRALKGKRAYMFAATPEPVRARKGATLTLTRESGLAPKTAPITQSQKTSNLDNGLTSDVFSTEQYTLTMNEYMATADLGLMDDEVVIVNQAFTYARAQGEQAASTLELLARAALLNAGMAGNTRVINNGSNAPTTTTCQVDDIRGFAMLLKLGVLTAVSGSNTLNVSETGTTAQTLVVTGVLADVTNVSSAAAAGGISGVITFQTATAPTVGDVLLAVNATAMVRPNGKNCTTALTSQDVFTLGTAYKMSVILDNNGVPRFDGNDELPGGYLCFVSPTSHSQLLQDPAFEKAYQGQYNSYAMSEGVITHFQGITYIKTNFAVSQSAATANGTTVAVNVERPIMVGKDCLIRGDFEGMEDFVRRQAKATIHDMKLVEGVIFNIRDALDRAGQYIAMTWDTIIDFECPSDMGTTNQIIPTANGALFKRIVVCEHAA